MQELIKPKLVKPEKERQQDNEAYVEAFCESHSGWCFRNTDDSEEEDLLF